MASHRDPWFDNAKMALVTLVVLGHSWVLLPDSALVEHLYDFLYAWHVPAFVLVTGYLSRSFSYTRARLWSLVRTVAVPYVLFEAGIALFRIHVGGEQLEDLWRDPHWPMWFLSALFFWRLLTPVLRGLWGGLAVAVAVSLVCMRGYSQNFPQKSRYEDRGYRARVTLKTMLYRGVFFDHFDIEMQK